MVRLGGHGGKFGFTPEMLSSQIAEHLPKVIDKLTPNGRRFV
jgi:uncharacterized protein YidB (DUF937 family)